MNHDEVEDLLPGYALDALDAAEREQVEQHLRLCPGCQVEAGAARVIIRQLGFACPQYRPSAQVKAQLMERIGQEKLLVVSPAARRSQDAEGARWFVTARVPRWLVAAAILPWAVVAALIADVLLSAPHHNAPSMIVAGIYGRGGAYGQLAMDPQGTNAFLTVAHMPPLPPGRTYVCWLERNGRMERAGWFHLRGHDGEATALLRAAYPLNSYTLIAISIETRRDAARPSGTLLAAGKI